MGWSHILVIISALLMIVGASAYIRDTLKGRTKPNRISWFLWTLFPLIGAFAALQAHASIWATVRIFLAGFLPLIVFVASFLNKQSHWHLGFWDWICGLFALLALAVWMVFGAPTWAILFAVIGDVFAALPTVIKTWKYPETETGIAYVVSLLAVLLVLPSIPIWNIANAAFQIYLFFANLVMIIAIYRNKWFNRYTQDLSSQL